MGDKRKWNLEPETATVFPNSLSEGTRRSRIVPAYGADQIAIESPLQL